jgi:ribosome-binding protein aMBF1 (putative translation factor)
MRYSRSELSNSIGFSEFSFSIAGNVDCDYVRFSDRAAKEALDEVPKPLHRIAERKRSYLEGVGHMKRDKHTEFVERRARKSPSYRKVFARALQQIDLAVLVREMREDAGLTQTELARRVGTTQSVIARLEDAEYTGHSLTMLERIAVACGVALKLHAEKKPHFDREVALV